MLKTKKSLKRWPSNKEGIKASRFSKNSLIMFILVFGGLGAYLLFKSFAASPTNIAYGDLSGDSTVNSSDLSILLSNYGTANATADINGDGAVNIFDLSILLSHYGAGVPAQTGMLFGYQLHLSSQKDQANYINLAVNGGAKTVRDDFEWSAIEPSNNNFQWSSTDNLVSQASKAGLNVLAMVGYSPSWATGCSNSDKCGPLNNADYADVAAHVAARYGHGGTYWSSNPTVPYHPLVGIEVWNEPNLGFWTNPNPAKYTAMLKAAYPAIKSADPNMTVVSAGLAPQGGYNDYNCDDKTDDGGISEGTINQVNFLQAMYQDGAAGYMDAVGYHPYNWGGTTAAHYFAYHLCSGWSQMADTPVSIRSLMVANGDGNKQIWSTEAGGPTATGYLSESEQALLATQIVAKWKALPYVGNFYWYDLRDDCSDTTDPECRFGTVHQDSTLKPSYNALKTAWQ